MYHLDVAFTNKCAIGKEMNPVEYTMILLNLNRAFVFFLKLCVIVE